jgi:hypothetical protein
MTTEAITTQRQDLALELRRLAAHLAAAPTLPELQAWQWHGFAQAAALASVLLDPSEISIVGRAPTDDKRDGMPAKRQVNLRLGAKCVDGKRHRYADDGKCKKDGCGDMNPRLPRQTKVTGT